MSTYVAFCTADQVRAILSPLGVTNRLDDQDSGFAEDSDNLGAMDFAIQAATFEVAGPLTNLYGSTDQAIGTMAGYWAVQVMTAYLAAYQLAGRRGDPRAGSIVEDATRIKEELRDVQYRGNFNRVPGLLRAMLAAGVPVPQAGPAVDNIRIDTRYWDSKARFNTVTSTPGQSGMQRFDDYAWWRGGWGGYI